MTLKPSAATVLEPRLVGDIEGRFWVPRYQRGYRWGPHEVKSLLNDISESEGPYYLQPVVVKARGDESWELVDGQQRLTTLYLIIKAINAIRRTAPPSAIPGFSMAYETRDDSREYLEKVDQTARPKNPKNIDYFHIDQAYATITNWFQDHGQRQIQTASDFYMALSKRVYVIWYEVPPDGIDEMALFRRLNVGRIPLTDAELVKALLLSVSQDGVGGSTRVQEIAAHWDSIERDLRNPDLWAFVTAEAKPSPTHISLLLDTFSDQLVTPPSGDPRPKFFTFETLRHEITKTGSKFWDHIVDLHSLILGWYEDRNLYHKIGYLVASGHSFLEMVNLAKGKGRSEFDDELTALIRSDLSLRTSEIGDLSYSVGSEKAKCANLLLLMNVEATRRIQDSTERYSFQRHAAGDWSLEHIHAQSAEPLNRDEQWQAWLRSHREALLSMPGAAESHQELAAEIEDALQSLTSDKFRALEMKVSPFFRSMQEDGDDDSTHSLSNLALLATGDNSALSNSAFEVKRQEVLRRDRDGSYIPIATRNVFLKYYTKAQDQQIHFWSPQDRADYLEALIEIVSPYLLDDEAEDS